MRNRSHDVLSRKGRAECSGGKVIPRLEDVRRVSERYHHALPLPVIKQQQCLVLGAEAQVLTVGITERENEALLAGLHMLTGMAIFPVLIEPRRMHLLIRRLERQHRFRQRSSRVSYGLQLPSQVRLLLAFPGFRRRVEWRRR